MSVETAITFPCRGESLVGILHRPARPQGIGVIVVVGGPQYRVGSHRQFTLLARHLAGEGYPVLRFDCRGMGDSSGEFPGFEAISADISAAVDTLSREMPGVRTIALWGLCDAASASLLHAAADSRIAALVLLNPWVRTEATLAQTYLRHYYLARLVDREFWRKLAGGRLNPARVLHDLAANIRGSSRSSSAADDRHYVTRMRDALRAFDGPVLIVLSGNDITANEFAAVAATPEWAGTLERTNVTRHDMRDANHTFSTRAWRDEVAQLTVACLQRVECGPGTGPRP